MCSQEDPEDGITSLQMNSELQHAQLELLSAHCAVHQLRLHYSPDALARLGRRDILHKSVEAASAIHAFYSAIEGRLPTPAAGRVPQFSAEQIAQAERWLSACLRAYRERYLSYARPLSIAQRTRFAAYFAPSLLEEIRIAELHGKRVEIPDFFAEARALGFDSLPDITHMDSLTFLDVIVFNETFTERALFHGLVHAVQLQVLGLERYAQLWVRGVLKTRAHFTVPLEVQAFSMASRFVRPTQAPFSVENEVLLWQAEDRY
jgi:hypothetical protein